MKPFPIHHQHHGRGYRFAVIAAALGLVNLAAAELTIHDVAGRPGQRVVAMVEVRDMHDLFGLDLQLSLPAFAAPGPADTVGLASEFLVASRTRPGSLDVAMASSSGLEDADGMFLRIPIAIAASAPQGVYGMEMTRLRLYDGVPQPFEGQVVSGTLTVLPPPEDSDEDGLDDDWEMDFFNGTTAEDGEGDADNDGASNRAELLAGTDPTSPDSLLLVRKIGAASVGGGREVVLEWEGQSDRDYDVYWSDGPLHHDMTWRQVYHPNLVRENGRVFWTDNGTRTLRLPEAAAERFYRILAKPPGNAADGPNE